MVVHVKFSRPQKHGPASRPSRRRASTAPRPQAKRGRGWTDERTDERTESANATIEGIVPHLTSEKIVYSFVRWMNERIKRLYLPGVVDFPDLGILRNRLVRI